VRLARSNNPLERARCLQALFRGDDTPHATAGGLLFDRMITALAGLMK
jgi:hypothetical protein